MRMPVLTPEQAAAAQRAAMLEREQSHAAAEERRTAMLQVRMPHLTRPAYCLCLESSQSFGY